MEFEIIRKIVAEVMKLDPKEVSGDTTFIEDLGADSLDVCRIIMNVQEEFAIVLPRESIYTVNSVNGCLELIRGSKNNSKPR